MKKEWVCVLATLVIGLLSSLSVTALITPDHPYGRVADSGPDVFYNFTGYPLEIQVNVTMVNSNDADIAWFFLSQFDTVVSQSTNESRNRTMGGQNIAGQEHIFKANISTNFTNNFTSPGPHSLVFCTNSTGDGSPNCTQRLDFIIAGVNATSFEESVGSGADGGPFTGLDIRFGNGTDLETSEYMDPLVNNYTMNMNFSGDTGIFIIGMRINNSALSNVQNVNHSDEISPEIQSSVGEGFEVNLTWIDIDAFLPDELAFDYGMIQLPGTYSTVKYCNGTTISNPSCQTIQQCNGTAIGLYNFSTIIPADSACYLTSGEWGEDPQQFTAGYTYILVDHFSGGLGANDFSQPKANFTIAPNITSRTLRVDFGLLDNQSTGFNLSQNRTINLSIFSSGSSILEYKYLNNSATNLSCTTEDDVSPENSSFISCNVTIDFPTDGSFVVNITAHDASNNSNALNVSTSSDTVLVDTSAPRFILSSLQNSSSLDEQVAQGTNLSLSVNITDALAAVDTVILFGNISGQSNNALANTTTLTDSLTANISYVIPVSLIGHTINFTFFVNDTLSNTNSSPAVVFEVIDSTVPSIVLNSPSNFANSSSTTQAINFTATDNSNENMNCTINISQSGSIAQSIADLNVTSAVHQVNTSQALANGTYQWSVNCTDSSGNVNTSIAREFSIDSELPSFYNISISTNNASVNEVIHFSAVWNDSFTSLHTARLLVNLSGSSTEVNSTTTTSQNRKINLSFMVNTSLDNQVYSFSMWMNDSAGNANTTPTQIVNITNSIAPTISVTEPAVAPFDLSTLTPAISVAADTVSCKYSTNTTQNVSNVSMSLSGTTCTGSAANFQNANGVYNFTFYATDNAGNEGSLVYYLNVSDTTAPNAPVNGDLSVSESDDDATITISNINESSNATVIYGTTNTSLTSSASQLDFATSQAVSFGNLSASTTYFYNITVCDRNDNCAMGGLFSLTTDSSSSTSSSSSSSSSSSGGGGGGGGGGGTTSTNAGSSASKLWSSLTSGEQASMTISKDDIPISEITFTSQSILNNAELRVAKVDDVPVSDVERDHVYSYLDIDPTNLASDDFGSATLEFFVEWDWVADNNISPQSIKLFRYTTQWEELSTTLVSSDSSGYSYSATTPGFSYFAIAGNTVATVNGENEEEETESTNEENTEQAPESGESPIADESERLSSEGSSNIFLWLIIIIGIGCIGGGVFVVMKNKQKAADAEGDDMHPSVEDLDQKNKPEGDHPKTKNKFGMEDEVSVTFLHATGKFVGQDYNIYGPFLEGQTATLPNYIAKTLEQKHIGRIQH